MRLLLAILQLISALRVKAQSDGDVRFVNGLTRSSGRVEIYHEGVWGSVCDDRFDRAAAQVACRSGGYRDARPTYFSARTSVGVGTGRILLDELRCDGPEANLLLCGHLPINTGDCEHSEDVAVDCYGQDVGKVAELQNGTNTSGVLVLLHGGISGTVCYSRYWGVEEARVACRMLGHNVLNIIPMSINRAFFAETSDLPIMMSEVRCQGNEDTLSGCRFSAGASRSCTRATDVAIDCIGTRNLEVTLVNGNRTAGELQLTYGAHTGPVCGDIYATTAQVFCRMLGNSRSYGVLMGHNSKPSGTSGFTYRAECHGYETNTFECRYGYTLDLGPCSASSLIACISEGDIDVLLSGGNDAFGRLEVQHEGIWGTVCNNYFTRNEAKVFCRMLGQPSENAMVATPGEGLAEVGTPILLDDVSCSGTETHLYDCYHNGWGNHDCAHSDDVWIRCA